MGSAKPPLDVSGAVPTVQPIDEWREWRGGATFGGGGAASSTSGLDRALFTIAQSRSL